MVTEVQLLSMASAYLTCMVRPMLYGYKACTIHSCPTVKVTIVMVMSVGNLDMQSCSVMPPFVKVTIIMVTSPGNPDVTSCLMQPSFMLD